MYKFHLKFRPTSREPMIEVIKAVFNTTFAEARDIMDNGLVVTDKMLGALVSALNGSITRENETRRLAKQWAQPNVPYTRFACTYELGSYDYRPAINREPVMIPALIEA